MLNKGPPFLSFKASEAYNLPLSLFLALALALNLPPLVSHPLYFPYFSQEFFNLALFLCQASCLVLAQTDRRQCGWGRGLGRPCHLALWLVPSLCAWPCPPEIPGVGAF